MNLRPPQPLDAEERALARALPRLHGRTTPGPDIDASILAAAQAAVQPAKPASPPIRPRVRWIAPTALAASMVLAVGMAWQLRPLPTLEPAQPLPPQSDAAASRANVMVAPDPAEQPLLKTESKPVPQAVVAPARRQDSPPETSVEQAIPRPRAMRAEAPPPPAPAPPMPTAPPAPPPPAAMAAEAASPATTLDTVTIEHGSRQRASAAAASANAGALARDAAPASADKARVADSVGQALPKASNPAPAKGLAPEARNEAEMAAEAGFVGDPDEDIPPATAASPAVRDAWLHRIGELLDQGRRQEAKASLAEFRRRYPAVVLPPALRTLESEP